MKLLYNVDAGSKVARSRWSPANVLLPYSTAASPEAAVHCCSLRSAELEELVINVVHISD